MKILVICHVEQMFLNYMPDELPIKIANYARLYDRVLVIESASELTNDDPLPEIENFNWVETWCWGFEKDQIDLDMKENRDYIICKESNQWGGRIYDWMHDLPKDAKYYFAGGGRNECLATVLEIFQTMKYNCKVIESLTY